ncbi:MAG: DNA polymerase II large subunit [Candidatus ainarchaeum sp.]|nr:DNA polymerase II large subunit [Candidatus ainarchaeum sp.]
MNYFDELEKELEKCYSIATKARKKGFDPEKKVEIKITSDIASRVEGLVGPEGIEKIIRSMEKEEKGREEIAFEIVRKIASGEIYQGSEEKRIEQAIRTGVAIITEGVLVAPTEGIAKVKIRENPDGSNYISVYYAGPIRSAGGTAAGLSVLIADIARLTVGIGNYRPTDTEVERYVEEINIYEARVAHLQYKPKDEDIRIIIRNCPICIDGEPTDEVEVSVYKNLERVETNRIRGGVPLVVCEGIALKAAKLLKYVKKQKIEWNWLEKIIKIKIKEDKVEIKPDDGYLDGLVAGRPVFSYPSSKGGFRLRYGKTRTNGIMAKSVHPAIMVLLNEFLAYGTQMKIERPGKGCIVTSCNNIESPIVKLKNGDVVRVNSIEQARKINPEVKEILFLGDIVSSLGDFIKSNHPLMSPGYCKEWWERELDRKGLAIPVIENAESAFLFSKTYDVPLHPEYTLFWDSINIEQLNEMVGIIEKAELRWDGEKISEMKIEDNDAKNIFEELLVEHIVRDGKIVFTADNAYSILGSLGVLKNKKIDCSNIKEILKQKKKVLETISESSGIVIRAKGGTYIGTRMGRPEKAKERSMDGKPHSLFPTGSPKNRSLVKIYKSAKEIDKLKTVNLELSKFKCINCSHISIYPRCSLCGGDCEPQKICQKCNAVVNSTEHCGRETISYEKRPIALAEMFEECRKVCGGQIPDDVKGVKGLSNKNRIPERLEKGVLRAKYGVYVYKDGTARFDATDVPLTHFKPNEIGLSVKKAIELGYERDYLGKELVDGEQIVPLKVQDILLSENGAEYFIKVSKFIDDLLINLYSLPSYYNIEKREELIGHLLVGFTKANVGYAHPHFHTAKRRNADADEDCVMLLMDSLLNFSRKYLSERRGGTMDAPILLNVKINPKEVDDEVFCMEVVDKYPLEFYESCMKNEYPYKIKIKKVEDILGKEEQYGNLSFTLDSESIDKGVVKTKYVELDSVPDKIANELELEEKIRCVDEKDVAKRIILNHFLPDLYGNLRTFSRQSFRCVNCNEIYRRVPLIGKCRKCGGNLTLTIHKGGIKKYLEISQMLCNKYDLPVYLKQRIKLIKKEIEHIFEDEKIKQMGLSDFV